MPGCSFKASRHEVYDFSWKDVLFEVPYCVWQYMEDEYMFCARHIYIYIYIYIYVEVWCCIAYGSTGSMNLGGGANLFVTDLHVAGVHRVKSPMFELKLQSKKPPHMKVQSFP